MRHIIKKQEIDLLINKKLDAFNIQQQVSEHYWSHILPVLEKEFDKISNQEEIVYIERLEIDLDMRPYCGCSCLSSFY